jgi:folate-binding protein YgfZ
MIKEHMQKNSTGILTGDFLTQLDNKGIISVGGEDKVTYLQGQLSADVAKLDRHHALLTCHCDFKGKTWNVCYAAEQQDDILLISPKDSIPKALSELKKYGVFAKVEIQDSSQQWLCFGGAGEKLEKWIIDKFGDVPFEHQQVFSNQSGLVIALASPQLRYLLVLSAEAAQELCQLYDGALSSPERWECADIHAGIAEVREATSNQFVPQMMNLQALQAISFSKGCYMGQEVVARTKYLGKNKRAAFILCGAGQNTQKAGDSLEFQVGENWRIGGTILRCAFDGEQSWLLAILPNDSEVGSLFRAKTEPQCHFVVKPLPYALD